MVIGTGCIVICDRLAVSLGTPVSATNKADLHKITEILLKMALNTISLSQTLTWLLFFRHKLFSVTAQTPLEVEYLRELPFRVFRFLPPLKLVAMI
jgi:hypothetical protein